MSIFHVEDRFFGLPKVQEGLQHHIFLIFDGKQYCKKIWFRGCQNHPWLLFLINYWWNFYQQTISFNSKIVELFCHFKDLGTTYRCFSFSLTDRLCFLHLSLPTTDNMNNWWYSSTKNSTVCLAVQFFRCWEIVFFFQNCSDLLWEKIVLVI